MAEEARAMGARIAERLGYVGLLCVEMFVTGDGELLVNEMAPRRTTAVTGR
jgi:5-(carboxyamino)imidazole ribonucleotide synthase